MTLCEEWILSIDLKLPNRSTTEWSRVLNLQFDGSYTEDVPSIPTVWIKSDKSDAIKLKTCQSFIDPDCKNNKNNYFIGTTKEVNADNWLNLKISQMSGIYEIKLDYKTVHKITKFVSKKSTNVNLLIGNTSGKESISTIVNYRNFKINTCKRKGKIVVPQKIDTVDGHINRHSYFCNFEQNVC